MAIDIQSQLKATVWYLKKKQDESRTPTDHFNKHKIIIKKKPPSFKKEFQIILTLIGLLELNPPQIEFKPILTPLFSSKNHGGLTHRANTNKRARDNVKGQ